VDSLLLAAADNNARWCDIVCRSHGVPTAFHEVVWLARRRSPPLYPDAVTLRPGLSAEAVLRDIDDGPGCSLKDSFADLDLAPLGFEELFSASWIAREPDTERGGAERWSAAESDLDPSVRTLAAEGAGAVANRTGSVVGVSNVSGDDAWTGLAEAVWREFPGLTLVGYEHGDDLDAALAAGFEEIGPLRIWLR
jgi:hypothetical protein